MNYHVKILKVQVNGTLPKGDIFLNIILKRYLLIGAPAVIESNDFLLLYVFTQWYVNSFTEIVILVLTEATIF